MADDGMLMNFEIGDALLKTQIKFKGGRWRDRVRAQKSANKTDEKKPTAEKPTARPAGQQPRRYIPGENADKSTQDDAGFDDSDRPTKKRRVETLARPTGSATQPTFNSQSGRQQHNVTSRLFTANPIATTAFDQQAPVDESDPVKPSNAPLSEEAENFAALGLSRRVAQHLSAKLEMKAPTSIQKNTIPQLVKDDSDAFLQAETGSGKTLAYLLPIVQRIMALTQTEDGSSKGQQIHRNSGLFAIILAPTRELCKQISVVLEKLLRCAPWIVSTTVMGGESKKSEKARIRKGVNILIATPGRLTDHLDHTKVLDVGTVRWLVLDEGDRLMELGFEDDIKTIVAKIREEGLSEKNRDGIVLAEALPSRRVTVLCSATMKMNVQKLGDISLEDAIHITSTKSDGEDDAAEVNAEMFAAPSQLRQSYVVVPSKLRLVTLIAFLKDAFARKGSVMKAIIFISCADSVDFHFELLKTAPLEPLSPESPNSKPSPTASTVAPAAYITSSANPVVTLHKLHGSLAQPVRTATLQSFTKSTAPSVLITTDISSRGLDVPAVDLVVEYDPAFAVADHVHRIGRTARAGRAGKAALFLLPGCEEGYVSLLHSSSQLTPQSYDAVLQKGLSSAVALPAATSPAGEVMHSQPEKQSYTARAEALQLHLEQRLLAKGADPENDAEESGKKNKHQARGRGQAKDSKLLDAARLGFRSHIRAYATHVRDERGFFDITKLHLGHMAKSFGLREAPGGIGGGVSRRTHRPAATGAQKNAVGKKRSAGEMDSDDDCGDRGKSAAAASAGGGGGTGGDGDGARRMREKMKAVMSAGAEFNIG